ncbi:MAG: uroporphyrinogen decarboxylase family protein [Candidatus Latescibacteria bacterium]|nr:hypothetical protein [Gemmatimonadaceae bacterium]MDP6015769.1 uroporphyrinogen decarboxylase family protein [Candidatus Latescibacterota bacterium]MDP7449875.1 uroporphyrinogen decarboxylase family protein [Candidatus Latescibacterota bacterium]HJP31036.1 uroporphyrinogen decarboxylase family protein [Candidatus Latescibacterota bacterium]
MNSRERVSLALRREQPDRVPWCELAVDRALAQRLMGWGPAGSEAYNMEVHPFTFEQSLALAEHLGLDNLSYVLRAPVYAEKIPGKEGRLFYGDGLIRSREDLNLLDLPDPHDDALYEGAAEFVERKGDYSAWFITRVGIFPTTLSMGLETFSIALYEDLGFIEEVLNTYVDWAVVVAQRVCELGFDAYVSTDDMAFGTGPFFSPQVLRDVVMPGFRRVAEHISIPWIIHSDGNMLPFMDDLMSLGIAGMHPFEKDAMDIAAAKRQFGDRLCILGNVDLNILGMGTPKEVEDEVRYLIDNVGPGGGYIISSGNSLAAYVLPENANAMAAAVRSYGRY